MWPWKKPGEPGKVPPGIPGREDGSIDMPEETDHSDMTEDGEMAFGDSGEAGRLAAELENEKARSLRLMADFQNYQRRALQNEVVARQQGVSAVASSVVTVLDHFDTALSQDKAASSVEQLLEGMRLIRGELLKALGHHGVGLLSPQPGDAFEPGKHEAIMQQKAEGIGPGHVVSTFQSGYTLGGGGSPERVLRPAKVVVAPQE